MPQLPQNIAPCGDRDIQAQTALAPITNPLPNEPLSGVTVDRELERNFAIVSGAVTGMLHSERAEAAIKLQARNNEPEVALRLVELAITTTDSKVRQLAERALAGTTNQEAKDILLAEQLIRKTHEGGGKFETGPENPDELIDGLKTLGRHPRVAARLVETIISGSSGAFYAASALQDILDPMSQQTLKAALTSALDRGHEAAFQLKTLWQVPRALKYSPDPEIQALIIRAYKDGTEAFNTNNLRFEAARAMGAINTPEVHALMLESVMSPHQDWHVKRGIAEAIQELDAEELNTKLLPLINGSASKTAWIIAGGQSGNVVGQVARWASLLSSYQSNIHDVRVQVALALKERQPELAAKVFDEALKGKRDSFTHRCQFFAAGDALRGLETLEAAA